MVKLKVNFSGGILKLKGSETGIVYTYNPAELKPDDIGYVYVNNQDAVELKTRIIKTGCGCSKDNAGDQLKTEKLFEEA